VLDERAVSWTATRSGGPGGQHANTSDTAVELTIVLADAGLPPNVADQLAARLGPVLTVRSADSRSQWRNRRMAWTRAAARLDEAAVPVRSRRATKPRPSSVAERLEGKRRRSERKASRGRIRPDDE
jgi:ribosome-associated protein